MRGLGYPLYVNGKRYEEPVTISHVPVNGYGGPRAMAVQGLGRDVDPSMGGLGRMSALGQYVSYHPNLGAADAESAAAAPAETTEPTKFSALAAVAGPVFAGLGIYHGYKRNNSVGWALGWGLLTATLPIIMIPLALSQGFGKPKAMHANRSRRGKRSRNASSKLYHVYAEDGFESAHRSLSAAKKAAARGSKRRGLRYEVAKIDAYGYTGGGHGTVAAVYNSGTLTPNRRRRSSRSRRRR